jgi:cytochrome c
MRLLRLTTMAFVALAGTRVEAQKAPIRILVVTATHGFRHTEAIVESTKRLTEVQAANEFAFDFTEDPSTLNKANLAKYDVLFLDNSTLVIALANPNDSAARAGARWPPRGAVVSPVTLEQQNAIASFVRDGKGLVAAHAGIDALFGSPQYREIVGGGLFRNHPYTREARVTIEDPKNPAVAHLAPSLLLKEEYYYLDVNPRPNSHVVASLDLTSVGDTTKTDHPLVFVKRYGKGRVFVNVLGHFAETWRRDDYFTSILQGIRIAAGRIPADFSTPR